MIKNLSISGLGPHRNTRLNLDPRGVTVLSGASEAGKTTALRACIFALFGEDLDGRPFPTEWIRIHCKAAAVELTLANGARLRRSINRKRSISRELERGGELYIPTTEVDWRSMLGRIGSDPELVRVIMAPLVWCALAAGKARPLRDLIGRAAGDIDLQSIVSGLMTEAGATLEPDHPIEIKAAEALRRRVKQSLAEATGRQAAELEAVERAAAERPRAEPSVRDIGAAQAVVRARNAWKRFDESVAVVERHAVVVRRHEEWVKRRDALPKASSIHNEIGRLEAAVAEAEAQLDDLEEKAAAPEIARRVKELTESMQAAMIEMGRVKAEVAQLGNPEALEADGACPTCDQPLTEGGSAAVLRRLADGESRLAQARERFRKAEADLEAATDAATEREAATAPLIAAAEINVARARRDRDEALAAARAFKEVQKALGPEPEVGNPPKRHPKPGEARPSDAAVAAAQKVLDTYMTAQARAEAAADRLEQAEARLKEATARVAALAAKVDTLEALVAALRRAPTVATAMAVERLGDMGPVTLAFPEGGPEVEILVDGRPWSLASRGRLVVADLAFRAGLRRAFDMPFVPIFVDNRQDVGGQPLPDVEGPVVVMRTTDEPTLKVESFNSLREAGQ